MIDDLLPEPMLARFRERAAEYDANNEFFAEDFDELRAAGYLAAPVSTEMGGAGLSFEALAAAQRRLAAFAPATALGVNMHLVWVQVARFLHDRGIDTLDWVLHEATAGEVFAFGISEAGNEAVLLDSFSTAERDELGYLITGTKIFTTLSPVWTRLGLHARSTGHGDDGADPQLIFGFVRRDRASAADFDPAAPPQPAEGTISHPGVWNPLGMRATQSLTTRLEGVRVADADVAATMAPFDGGDPLILAIFSSFSVLTAAVYAGIADRALALASEAANRVTPVLGGDEAALLDDPDVAARLTSAVLEHRASLDALAILARDVDERRVCDDWFLALAAARNRVTDEARDAVEVAMRLVGSRGFQADSELARLYRDVLAGLFHPSSSRALARTVRGALSEPQGRRAP